jgi:flagellar hook-associated protein 2
MNMSDMSVNNSVMNLSWQYGHIGGLASGLDTDSIIKGLMTIASAPLDKLNQQKQIWQWKQDDYRSVNSTLLDFRNTVFNLKLQGTFLAKTTTSSDPTAVTAKAAPTAGMATITLSNITLAKSASVVSTNTVSDPSQSKIDPNQPVKTQIGNLNPSARLAAWAQTPDNTYNFQINGESFTFNPSQDSLNALISRINADSKAGVSVFYDDSTDKIVMTTTSTGSNAKIQIVDSSNVFGSLFGMNTVFVGSQTVAKDPSQTLDPNQPLDSQMSNLNWSVPPATQGSLTVNGVQINYDTSQDSLNSLIQKINTATNGDVTLNYDATTQKVTLTTKTGAFPNITNDNNNVFSSLFGLTPSSTEYVASNGNIVAGTDASFTINGLQTTRSSNTFTINGVTINLLKDTNETITIQSSPDVDTIFNTIKDFVDKYNSTIDTLNKLYNEPRYSDYPPLTDAQRQQMTDQQIQQWEAKAKSGMLKGDTLLGSAIDNMRIALSGQVNGVTSVSQYTSLSQIGITTGQWYENGKLYIDETTLRQAIQNDPNGVMQLFTNAATTDPVTGKVTDSSTEGLAGRLYDAINNAINQIGQTAGMTTDLVDNSFIGQTIRDINQQIADLQDQLNQKQQQYIQQFTALETAMAQMNSQSQYLMSSFSSSGK